MFQLTRTPQLCLLMVCAFLQWSLSVAQSSFLDERRELHLPTNFMHLTFIYVYIYVTCIMYIQVPTEARKGVRFPRAQFTGHSTWVLGNELGSSRRAESALSHKSSLQSWKAHVQVLERQLESVSNSAPFIYLLTIFLPCFRTDIACFEVLICKLQCLAHFSVCFYSWLCLLIISHLPTA